MNKILEKLKISEKYTRKPDKYDFDKVTDNTFPMGHYNYMADLLELPKTKNGYKYLLTMVDIWSNRCDFEPIKNKESKTVLDAMLTIFNRKILKQPKASIRTDNGSEFKGVFHKYLFNNNILHRQAEPYRHKQLANIESLNRQLGRLLNGYMNQKEQETNAVYREWVEIIPFVRTQLNRVRLVNPDKDPYELKYPEINTESKYNVGDLVYYKSEIPLNALGQKQPTDKFRMGDYRWAIKDARPIKQILYYPNNIRYILDGKPHVSYAEAELLPAETTNKYIVKKILDKKLVRGKPHYLIWWKAYKKSDSTWESEVTLLEDGLENMINDFNK